MYRLVWKNIWKNIFDADNGPIDFSGSSSLELPVFFFLSMVVIMNATAFLFILGFSVFVVGFMKTQILSYRFVKCYYREEGYLCDLVVIHTRGAYAELAMILGFVFALIVGVIQFCVTGSCFYLLLCTIGFFIYIASTSLINRWEDSLRQQIDQ